MQARLKRSRVTVKRSERHLAELKEAFFMLRDGLTAREKQYNRMEKLVRSCPSSHP